MTAVPPALANDTSITVFPHNIGARVVGRISLQQTLPTIVGEMLTPSLSVAISDPLGGVVIATTQLQINPSPPLFDSSHYSFNVLENSSRGTLLGPVRVIDPNGGPTRPPTVVPNDLSAQLIFSVIDARFSRMSDSPDAPPPSSSAAYSSYNLLVNHQFNYEQIRMLEFQLMVMDAIDNSLTSIATVRVDILPVNEFPPVFTVPR